MSATDDKQAYGNRDQEIQESHKAVEGERLLLTALLRRSIEDLASADEFVKTDAYQWFIEKELDSCPKPFSYLYVCESLGFDAEVLFEQILKNLEIKKP